MCTEHSKHTTIALTLDPTDQGGRHQWVGKSMAESEGHRRDQEHHKRNGRPENEPRDQHGEIAEAEGETVVDRIGNGAQRHLHDQPRGAVGRENVAGQRQTQVPVQWQVVLKQRQQQQHERKLTEEGGNQHASQTDQPATHAAPPSRSLGGMLQPVCCSR